MPPTVPIHHYLGPGNQRNKTKVLFHYSMLNYSCNTLALNTLIFQSKGRAGPEHPIKGTPPPAPEMHTAGTGACAPTPPTRKPQTTSFLTASTLIYAPGEGITAAAGTSLALQLVLDGTFTSLSLQ